MAKKLIFAERLEEAEMYLNKTIEEGASHADVFYLLGEIKRRLSKKSNILRRSNKKLFLTQTKTNRPYKMQEKLYNKK